MQLLEVIFEEAMKHKVKSVHFIQVWHRYGIGEVILLADSNTALQVLNAKFGIRMFLEGNGGTNIIFKWTVNHAKT